MMKKRRSLIIAAVEHCVAIAAMFVCLLLSGFPSRTPDPHSELQLAATQSLLSLGRLRQAHALVENAVPTEHIRQILDLHADNRIDSLDLAAAQQAISHLRTHLLERIPAEKSINSLDRLNTFENQSLELLARLAEENTE